MIDSIVGVFLYFLYPVLLISISIYVSHKKEMTLESYFFANRDTHWFVLAISFLTTCLFTLYVLGLTSPVLVAGYGLLSVFMLFLLGKFLAPFYLKKKINTIPEYFEKRFNRSCKFFLSVLYILYNVFVRLVIILIVGSIAINQITGIDTYSSLLFLLIITGIYIIIGGLRAEMIGNMIQALLITLGFAVFSVWIIYSNEIPLVINKISSLSYFHSGITQEFTWPGLIIGLPVISFWFWCADQFVIQKFLSARNNNSVRKAVFVTIFLQTLIVLVFVLPWLIAVDFVPGLTGGNVTNTLFYTFLPENLRGILIIAIYAALVASFSSFFNSTSSLITLDFYRSFNPAATDRKLVLVGRLSIMILLFFAILLIPVAQSMEFTLGIKLFKSFIYFASLVTGVFIIGLINQKISGASALLTLLTGTIIILTRTFLEIFFDNNLGGNGLITWFAQSEFLEFSTFVFFLSVLLLFVFNKLEWVQDALSYFLRILKTNILKVKT